MELSNLGKTTQRQKKRIGRGGGSGKGGHTVGRGKSGQKSKGKVGLLFEGTKQKKSLLKRLPLLRGKGKFKSLKQEPIIVNLKFLNLFKSGEIVNIATLAEKRIITKEEGLKFGVKILGEGELAFPLIIQLPISKSARKKVEKVGGKVVPLRPSTSFDVAQDKSLGASEGLEKKKLTKKLQNEKN